MEKKVFGLFIIILLLIGYTSQATQNIQAPSNRANEHGQKAKPPALPSVQINPEQPIIVGEEDDQGTSSKKETGSHLFDPLKIAAGDTVAGMKVLSVEASTVPGSNQQTATVRFSGEATISGEYTCHNNDELLGSVIAFTVDDQEHHQLPRITYDERKLWFVFSNHDEAAKVFGSPGSRGRATVVINDYIIRYAPTDTYNEARLLKVIK
ncbi:MAG: hypothetical protein ACOY35_09550 [Bacillota bacterium]